MVSNIIDATITPNHVVTGQEILVSIAVKNIPLSIYYSGEFYGGDGYATEDVVNSVRVCLDNKWYNTTVSTITGDYEVSINAPEITSYNEPNHYYSVIVEVIYSEDTVLRFDASSLDSLKLFVKEEVPPIVVITEPFPGIFIPYNKPKISFDIIDNPNGSGIDLSTLVATLDGVELPLEKLKYWKVFNGYTFSYEPSEGLFEGNHILRVVATDYDGNTAEEAIVTFDTLDLIWDRKQQDVNRVLQLTPKPDKEMYPNEIAEWSTRRLKGAYNISDLNRVGHAVRYLTDNLEIVGYEVPTKPYTEWVVEDIPSLKQMEIYLQNIVLLRNVIIYPITTPQPPDSMKMLNYIGANHIEKILWDLYHLISYILMSFYYSGEFYSGDLY